LADPEVRAGEAKRGSWGYAPSGCAGAVPAGGLGAKPPRRCGIDAFCVMSKAFL